MANSSTPPVFTIQLRGPSNASNSTNTTNVTNASASIASHPSRALPPRSQPRSASPVTTQTNASTARISLQSAHATSSLSSNTVAARSLSLPPQPMVQEQMQNGVPRLTISLSSLYQQQQQQQQIQQQMQDLSTRASVPIHSQISSRSGSSKHSVHSSSPPMSQHVPTATISLTPRDQQATRLSINKQIAKNKQEFVKPKGGNPLGSPQKLSRSVSIVSNISAPKSTVRNTHAGRVRVSVRVRPPFASEIQQDGYQTIVQPTSIDEIQKISLSLLDGAREFNFDHVFPPNTTQENVYRIVGSKVVESSSVVTDGSHVKLHKDVLSGLNGTLLAYGQTGTGKTHTLGMLRKVREQPQGDSGILPRALNHVFSHVSSHAEDEWTVNMGFFQIYMESVQDLLVPANDNLPLREDPEKGFYVDGLEEVLVSSFEEAMQLVNKGLENRVMAPTLMNATSSRSHTVLLLRIQRVIKATETYDPTGAGLLFSRTFKSKLYIVDLAGSERVKKSQSEGARLSEAKAINQSLSALGNVIAALTDPRPKFVPYRDSKLTKILQDSLGGNSSTHLIAAIAPGSDNRDETLSTLSFASRCLDVKTFAVVNEDVDYRVLCMKLQAQIQKMEQDIQMRECLMEAQIKAVGEEATPRQQYPPEFLGSSARSAVSFPSEALPEATAVIRAGPDLKTMLKSYDHLRTMHTILSRLVRQSYQRETSVSLGAASSSDATSAEDQIIQAERMIILQRFQQNELVYPTEMLETYAPEPSSLQTEADIEAATVKIQTAVNGLLGYLSQLLDRKDDSIQQMREELIFHGIEKRKRDDELVNWSFVLRYLLNTNSQLRRELQTHAHQMHRIVTEGSQDASLQATPSKTTPVLAQEFNQQLQIATASLQQEATSSKPNDGTSHSVETAFAKIGAVGAISAMTGVSSIGDPRKTEGNQRPAEVTVPYIREDQKAQNSVAAPKRLDFGSMKPVDPSTGVDTHPMGSLSARIRQFDHAPRHSPPKQASPSPASHMPPSTAMPKPQQNHQPEIKRSSSQASEIKPQALHQSPDRLEPKPRIWNEPERVGPPSHKQDVPLSNSPVKPVSTTSTRVEEHRFVSPPKQESSSFTRPQPISTRTPVVGSTVPTTSNQHVTSQKKQATKDSDDESDFSSSLSHLSIGSLSSSSTIPASKAAPVASTKKPNPTSRTDAETMKMLADLGISSDSEGSSDTDVTSELDSALGDILRNAQLSDGSDISGDLDDYLP